jgi:hypothetical protein
MKATQHLIYPWDASGESDRRMWESLQQQEREAQQRFQQQATTILFEQLEAVRADREHRRQAGGVPWGPEPPHLLTYRPVQVIFGRQNYDGWQLAARCLCAEGWFLVQGYEWWDAGSHWQPPDGDGGLEWWPWEQVA